MEEQLYEDETFEKEVYTGKSIKRKEFQNCRFVKCDLSGSEFSYNKFIDCTFEGCDLSMVKLTGSSLQNALFNNCKILGVNFSECHDFLFSVRFESCVLDYSSFMDKKMLKTTFLSTSLKEVNFTQTNAAGSVFDRTDLSGALFNRTDLTSADFATALNYSIDPELNVVKKAKFSWQGLAGLLDKYALKIV